jgi:diguanylate cyclase (GGDEF)-like protein
MAEPVAVPGVRLTPADRLGVAVGAAALCAWTAAAIVVASSPRTSVLWKVAFVAGLAALSQLPGLRITRRSGAVPIDLGVAAVLVGFVLVGPAESVVLIGPSVLMSQLLLRRPALTAVYDGAALTASTGAAYGLAELANPSAAWSSPRGVLGLALAALAFRACDQVADALHAAVTSPVGVRPSWADRLTVELCVLVGNVALALLLLAVVHADPSAGLILPLTLAVVLLAGLLAVTAHRERRLAAALERATADLNHLDEAAIAAVALTVACNAFRCRSAELQLIGDHRRPPRRYEIAATGDVTCRPGSSTTADSDGSPGVVIPLHGPLGDFGRFWFRPGAGTSLTRSEWDALRAFTQTVGLAILAAGLFDDVRAETARQVHQSIHDPLTGLVNRARLQEALRTAVDAPHNLTTALILLDLDHFKEINDTLGHAAGDLLLKRVAERLNALSRPGDLVSRLGGDEFAILLTGLESAREAGPAAEAVLRLLTEPVTYEGMRLSVEASVGLACYPADAADADELLRRAEVAMYQAKSDRGSWVRYEQRHDGSSVDRLALVAELRTALDCGEIVAHFQPQADLQTGEIVGVEALARWEHPDRGLLMPLDFIGVAEQSGLVRPFTLRILDLAVAECAWWAARGSNATVAVNLAARSLLDRELPRDVAVVLARHSLPPDRLVLEITETTAASEIEVVEEVLGRLRRLGVALSVDDFGTGYSSLAFLQRTKVNELKVDRSFVRGMLGSESDRALVRATVQLAHSLGARAVAEGVEVPGLAEALRGIGCDLGQGYWLSRPVPAEELHVLLGVDEASQPAPFRLPEPRPEQPLPVKHLRAVEG